MLVISTEDMAFHTADGPVDVTALANMIYRDLMGILPLEGDHEPATIGHFMGGDDAGYYSYLWAEVLRVERLCPVQKDGLFNAATGAAYRELDPRTGEYAGWDCPPQRIPQERTRLDVFYERLHIQVPQI